MDIDNDAFSEKCMARCAFIDAGLCPKRVDGSWDTDAFEMFWSKYMTSLAGQRSFQVYDLWATLQQEREQVRSQERKQRYQDCDDRKKKIPFLVGFLAGEALTLIGYLLYHGAALLADLVSIH